MCGIFGMIRCEKAEHPDRASAAFVELGRLAVQRGRDAAGFALATGQTRLRPTFPYPVAPTAADLNRRDTVIDGIRIIKDVCSFGDLWDDDEHLPLLAQARVALGHTRYATQGDRKAVANASPLLVGDLVGTHNGDVEVDSLSDLHLFPQPHGATDTERLYQALHRGRKDRRKVAKTLTEVEGRAALAWMDRGRADRVYLARAALSPLSIAWDAEGNLYWASNPDWFRQVDAQFDDALGFHDITMVREGMLLTIDLGTGKPTVDDMREFLPQCRPSDSRLSDVVVWRGFNTEDTKVDKAQSHHKVAPVRKPKHDWKSYEWGKPYSKSGTAQTSTLPRHDQPLPGMGVAEFGSSALASALAAEEPEVWDANEAAAESAISDEVDVAVIQWADEGCNPAVVARLKNTPTPDEETALVEEFGFSSQEAFRRFREEVLEWAEADQIEAEVEQAVVTAMAK